MKHRPGGFWIRFGASVIDGLILIIPLLAVNAIVALWEKIFPGMLLVHILVLALQTVLNSVLTLLYCSYFYQKSGATPGKALFKLKVLNESDESFLTLRQVFTREVVGKTISFLILMIGYIMAGLRSDKRALHDLMAGSRVVQLID
jgi:uncharacterized RDD family membrane protein YckC